MRFIAIPTIRIIVILRTVDRVLPFYAFSIIAVLYADLGSRSGAFAMRFFSAPVLPLCLANVVIAYWVCLFSFPDLLFLLLFGSSGLQRANLEYFYI